jgi:hypothetical protein
MLSELFDNNSNICIDLLEFNEPENREIPICYLFSPCFIPFKHLY